MGEKRISFSDLTLEECIGKGNFGEVWKGRYLGLDVAIKKLFFVDDDFMHKYIEREMDTLRGLSHPNIVQLMGYCTETGDIYIVTEFVANGNLRAKLKDAGERLSWKRRISFARDVALAMNYLHHKNIMHRDLKSANLLIGSDWRIKVCDFGLARTNPTDGEKYITTVGTNEWMAPEVALQDPYGPSADVFSYGMVLYELITREKPPLRKLRDGYAFHPENYKSKIPKETPEELWQLMVDCTATAPDARPLFADVIKRLNTVQVEDDSEDDEDEEESEEDEETTEEESEEEEASPPKKASAKGAAAKKASAGGSPSASPSTPQRNKSNGSSKKGKARNDDDDESSEEETMSYIARGREITEVQKIFKRAFRKPEFCKIECSIPKKQVWEPETEVPIKVDIENKTMRVIKMAKIYLHTERAQGTKKKIFKSKAEVIKNSDRGFPVKKQSDFHGQFTFTLPKSMKNEGDVQNLAVEFTLKRAFAGEKRVVALVPINVDN